MKAKATASATSIRCGALTIIALTVITTFHFVHGFSQAVAAKQLGMFSLLRLPEMSPFLSVV
jgi:hypothetical protein